MPPPACECADIAGRDAQLLAAGAALPAWPAKGTRWVTFSTPFASMLTCTVQTMSQEDGSWAG
jgi:hypothetical protein